MNLDSLKSSASGRWPEIISRLAVVDIELLDGKHHPCPSGKCSSVKDAFRFTDMDGGGSSVCNQCGKHGDGLATLGWLLGCEFKEAAARVAEYLGGEFAGKAKAKKKFTPPIESITILREQSTREQFARDFCKAKPGIEFDTLMACRWAPALWPRGGSAGFQRKVLAFVTYRLPSLAEHSFMLYDRNGKPFDDKAGVRKAHILAGRASGNKDGMFIAGTVDQFRAAKICYKCEGITDAITLVPALGSGEIAVANICGVDSVGWADFESFAHFEQVVIVADNNESNVGLSGANKFAGILL